MRLLLKLWKYNYSLVMRLNYCGAIMSCKKPREGEDWLRGRDMIDGKLWRLPGVLMDIFNCEMGLGRFK